jgi:uncharacterized ion transporter superfamily protein YfcC
MDEDVPIVATSKHIVVNTITAADDYLKLIQPTASALPVYARCYDTGNCD